MIEVLAEHETVHVLVNDEATRDQVRARMPWPQARSVQLHVIPTVDSWIRDYGPNFLLARPERRQPGEALAHNALAYNAWGFNAWGGKYETLMRDASVPRAIAPLLRVPVFEPGLVLEGGSIDVNGAGVVMTTEQCLLHPNRNPGRSRADLERALRDFLGVSDVLWLGEGVAGDDTDGHIDDIARFVSPRTIVCAVEEDPADPNYAPLQDNLRRLELARDPAGRPLSGRQAADAGPHRGRGRAAAGELRQLLHRQRRRAAARSTSTPTTRRRSTRCRGSSPIAASCPSSCEHLVWGMGAIHCVTQQQPKVLA